jgi:hypothetical protein
LKSDGKKKREGRDILPTFEQGKPIIPAESNFDQLHRLTMTENSTNRSVASGLPRE